MYGLIMMNNKAKTNLKSKIFYLSGIVLLVFILLYIIVVNVMYQMIDKELRSNNESMITIAVDQIQDVVELPVEMIDHVNFLIKDKDALDGQVVTNYLETIQKSYSYFTNIHIISRDGFILNTAPYDPSVIGDSVIYEPYYIKSDFGGQHWSEVYMSADSGTPTLSVTIQKEGYLIVADLDLLSLPINLNQNSYFDEIKNISILDQWGSYIVADNYEKVKARERFELFDILNSNDLASRDNISKKYHIGFRKIENMNWYIVFEFDYSKAYSNLNRFMVALFIIWGLLGSFMINYLRRYFKQVNGELSFLQARANAIINNNYDQKEFQGELNFKELNCLNNDFTVMMKTIEDREDKIISINNSLEKTVVDRTKDLEETNLQLEEEIQERENTEQEIIRINETLDQQVTERTEQLEFLNCVLEQSVLKAEEASEAKTRFLSIMSHEMRTPLNGIIGFLQILETTEISSEQEDIITTMNSSSRILLDLINDILEVEKYSAGKMIFDEDEIDLKQVIKESVNYYETLARNKNLTFEVEFWQDNDIRVLADMTKLKQLIGNLLSNALKFTASGTIKIICNAKINYHIAEVHISVIDTGIGMKDEVKPYLFTPFTQADSSIAGLYGGSGLGLTICKEIVNHYNGSIDYASTYGKGTTFNVDLKLSVVENYEDLGFQYSVKPQQNIVENEVTSVLVAEDNIVNQKLMNKFLQNSKLDYEIAVNGLEAVTKAQNKHFDVILMDCQMPIMDGIEATRRIRQQSSQKVRIIAMTAYASKEDKKHCLEAGMDDVITKPVDLKALAKMLGIEDVMNKHVVPPKKDHNLTVTKDATNLMEKIRFDYDTCLDLVNTYIEQAQKGFNEIEEYMNEGNYKRVGNILHQLKGASGSIYMERFGRRYERAEILLREECFDEVMICIDEIKMDPLFH